jgi:hypothetical protein
MYRCKYLRRYIMKKSVFLLFVGILTAMLSGCILSKTPKTNEVSLSFNEQMTFSINVFPSASTYTWTLDEVPQSNTGKSYDYTMDGSEHTLMVRAKNSFNDTQTWHITLKNSPPVASAGPDQTAFVGTLVTLDGSGSTDPDNNIVSYQWLQTGGSTVTLANNNTSVAQFTASVAVGSILTFKLTVTDSGSLQSTDTCIVTVQKDPKLLAQDALYTAYAGIGYGRADYTYTDDDELLYNVMLDDLNTATGNLILDTIFTDPAVVTKLINLVLGFTTTFTYTDNYGVNSSIKVNPGALVNGYRSFVADLSVNFSSTAYPLDPNNLLKCQYYGPDGGIDLTASVTGYFKATTAGLDDLFLSSVIIKPQSSLKAVYPKGEVRYNNWKIEYQAYYGEIDPTYTTGMSIIPVNMKVAPTLITQPVTNDDFRDYDLSGGFTLNGDAYAFGTASEVVNYQQEQESGLTLIYIAGKLRVPGMTTLLTISTSTVNPITRNIYGFWTSGLMNFAGLDGASQSTFSSTNYSCTFSGGSQGTWTVIGWQNALEP